MVQRSLLSTLLVFLFVTFLYWVTAVYHVVSLKISIFKSKII